jgi:hypothetical protein
MVFLYTNWIGELYIVSPVRRSLNQYGTVRYGTSHMIRELLPELEEKEVMMEKNTNLFTLDSGKIKQNGGVLYNGQK